MSVPHSEYTCDILVIGAGGAGLRAAIEGSLRGRKVCVVTKSLLGKAHTVMAEGGAAAALGNLDDKDNWQVHFKDTMFGGKYVNDWRMVKIFTQEAPQRIEELERWGAVFDRDPQGKILQRPFGGHTWRRLCHIGDRTGLEIIRTLQEKLISLDVDVLMEVVITRLLVEDGRIRGAVGFFKKNGDFILFKAGAVILATGGLGKIWKVTSNSFDCTGDGFGLAYLCGAELKDMEFVQFHPTGMVWPPGVKGILVTEAVRGEGGILKNSSGERFMSKYDPQRMELSTRDVVARAIVKEVEEGRGSPHGGVFLDISHKPAAYIKKKLPNMYEQFLEFADVDITKEAMEVGPTCHYMMGGVKVDPQTQSSTIEGLFACGEVAAGLHGGNRLGGNSLTDLLVFGRRAGLYAAEYSKGKEGASSFFKEEINKAKEEALSFLNKEGGLDYPKIYHPLQETMEKFVSIRRDETGLKEAARIITSLKEKYSQIAVRGNLKYNFGWHFVLSLKFMLEVGLIITESASCRKESRSSHYRSDYPSYDKEWGKKSVVVKIKDGAPSLREEFLPPLPQDLKNLLGDYE